MEPGEIAVIGFWIAYAAVWLGVWLRAARHYRRDISAAARLGIGLGFLRRENYTAEGQPYRRVLIWMYLAALPLMVTWAWLWDAL